MYIYIYTAMNIVINTPSVRECRCVDVILTYTYCSTLYMKCTVKILIVVGSAKDSV